jgi:hypothetical protein
VACCVDRLNNGAFWHDLLKFSKKTKIPLTHFIVEVHFDSLD